MPLACSFRGEDPVSSRYVLAIIGALKGVVFYRLADRLYQLDKEEVMAVSPWV